MGEFGEIKGENVKNRSALAVFKFEFFVFKAEFGDFAGEIVVFKGVVGVFKAVFGLFSDQNSAFLEQPETNYLSGASVCVTPGSNDLIWIVCWKRQR